MFDGSTETETITEFSYVAPFFCNSNAKTS